jgi:hypothetical protein
MKLLVIGHVTDGAGACSNRTNPAVNSILNHYTFQQRNLRPFIKYFERIRVTGIILLVILILLFQGKVSGQQTATITGTAEVCLNAASPVITFTGLGGVAPYEFTYTINGDTQSPISTSTESNTTSVSAPATTEGTFEYILVGVKDAIGNEFTVTTTTATITVTPLPAASITGILTACATTVLTAVTDAPSPLYTWYKDNVVIEGETGSTLVVTASGNYKVKIKNGSNSCEKISAVSAVIINPLPGTSAIWHF